MAGWLAGLRHFASRGLLTGARGSEGRASSSTSSFCKFLTLSGRTADYLSRYSPPLSPSMAELIT